MSGHANISLFVPHAGCPHRCAFCDQRTLSGQAEPACAADVARAVARALPGLKKHPQAELAFFGGSFTAIPRAEMTGLLEAALPFVQNGTVSGIRVSTRPDAVEDGVLALLKRYGVTAVELGAQSMDARVLEENRRGHTPEDVVLAAERVRRAGFSLGLQMMTGMYGDTARGAEETAARLAALGPDTVRIYPALVLRGSAWERWYRAGRYRPPSLEETVELCARLWAFFEARGIRVIRLGLHASPELEAGRVAGPWHPAFGELCRSRLFLHAALRTLTGAAPGEVLLRVSPRELSQALGQRRQNLALLQQAGYRVQIVPDAAVRPGMFAVRLPSGEERAASIHKEGGGCS